MTSYQTKIVDKPVCCRALKWLRDHSEVNTNGIIQVEQSINGMAAKQVITGMVNFDPDIPDGTKLRIIQQTLTKWRQNEDFYNSEDVVRTFKEALDVEILNLASHESSFTILAFLNIEQRAIEPLFPLTLQESKLSLPTWPGLESFQVDRFWNEAETYLGTGNKTPLLERIVTEHNIHYIKQTHDFIPITIESRGFDANTALHAAVDALDFFRAVINLPSALALFRRYGATSSSISKFLPSPVYGVFQSTGEYETLFYASESYSYKLQTITIDERQFCANLLTDLGSALPGELKYLLAKAIKLYQQAFDFSEYQATYLGLWQLLEILTLNEPSQGQTQVDKRIACLLGLGSNEVLRDAVKLLTESRNTLVHYGMFSEYAAELVFTLKGLVDQMLCRIFSLSNKLSTEYELREYYRLASKSDADLIKEVSNIEMVKGIIEFIKNSRVKK